MLGIREHDLHPLVPGTGQAPPCPLGYIRVNVDGRDLTGRADMFRHQRRVVATRASLAALSLL
jgi:hypothetical protein